MFFSGNSQFNIEDITEIKQPTETKENNQINTMEIKTNKTEQFHQNNQNLATKESRDKERNEIYNNLEKQEIKSFRKPFHKCDICSLFNKITHTFHQMTPKTEHFIKFLLNDEIVEEEDKLFQCILYIYLLISSFVLSDERQKAIQIKTQQEITILKECCKIYTINLIEIKNDFAYIEKSIFSKPIETIIK